ncbi:MAG: hypothetical protein QNJ00_06275 [Woeseiaceae bacterium]|nr:hypothetical protein [Woeseiaceae bacterium]
MTNHVDRFHAAVSILAGDGHIKQRLIRAFQDNLADIEHEDLPIPLQETYAELRRKLFRVTPANGEGPVCATVRKMSATEASRCAASVVSLYGELLQQAESIQYPAAADNDVGVPPFLVKTV